MENENTGMLEMIFKAREEELAKLMTRIKVLWAKTKQTEVKSMII